MTSAGEMGQGVTAGRRWSIGSSAPEVVDPYRQIFLPYGFGREGKTFFWESCPEALILNTDLKPQTNPRRVASKWPIMQDGRICDDDGTPFTSKKPFVWGSLVKMKDRLLDMAHKDEPRPRVIVLDSATAAMNMAVPMVAAGLQVKNIEEAPAFQAYPMLAKYLTEYMMDLWHAGYGIAWIFHLRYAHTDLKSAKPEVHVNHLEKGKPEQTNVELDIPGSIMKAIQSRPTICMNFERRRKPGAGGETTVTCHLDRSRDLHPMLKSMYTFLPPSFIVPEEDPWGAYLALFKKEQ